jgi:hypothetical protein
MLRSCFRTAPPVLGVRICSEFDDWTWRIEYVLFGVQRFTYSGTGVVVDEEDGVVWDCVEDFSWSLFIQA